MFKEMLVCHPDAFFNSLTVLGVAGGSPFFGLS